MQGNVDILINKGISTGVSPDTYVISGGGSTDAKTDLFIDTINLASYKISGMYYLFQGTTMLEVPPVTSNGYVYLDNTGVHVTNEAPPDDVIIIATFDSGEAAITRYTPIYGIGDELDSLIEDRSSYVVPINQARLTVAQSGFALDREISWLDSLYVMLTNSKSGAAQYNVIEAGSTVLQNNYVAYVLVNRTDNGAVLTVNQVDYNDANFGINALPLFLNKDGTIYSPRIPGFLPATPGFTYDPLGMLDAKYIKYANGTSGLLSTTVQAAIDEIKAIIDAQVDIQKIYQTYSPTGEDIAGSLTYPPYDTTQVRMIVNGTDQPNGIAFTVNGAGLITWFPDVAGFHLMPGDQIAYYYERVVS